jgi:murein DD-endopeptidase MepM/ murein hydrolase activator NlpD
MAQPISHALVLPDKDFTAWYRAAEPYTKAFERVAVVRSPAGNDLNRFRNVTAVQTPGVWFQNDAVTHIRRAYPMVVRIDLIRASTPDDLGRALAARVQNRDRYGEQQNADNHLFDRFTLDWPSDARPAKILRAFGDTQGGSKPNEGLDIYALAGVEVMAGAAGAVATVARQPTALGYGQYVQVASTLGGQQVLVTYGHLQNIAVNMGQALKVGDAIAQASGEQLKLVVQSPGKGQSGYVLPDVIDPTPLIYWQDLRLRSTDRGLRIRQKPGTEFEVLAQVSASDMLETLETHGRTLLKVGQEDEWIKVRTPAGIEGYAAAWFLEAVGLEDAPATNITGMNLDILHPLGKPDPARLKGVGWVRFAYNVSMGRGSTDLDAAYNLYQPHIRRYAEAGIKVLLVLTHQTFGEGQGYIWPQMDRGKWRDLTGKYADVIRRIAQRFAGRNQVAAYQIWNEQDTPPELAVAAVPMPAEDYGYLLAETIKAIRTVDSSVQIITGGHVNGPRQAMQYARKAFSAMPNGIRPDGVAFHPYGRKAPGSNTPYGPFGTIEGAMLDYVRALPDKPVWITEWGVLDHPSDPPERVTQYALDFLSFLKTKYRTRVAASIWYAWADGMHNGYGLVGTNDQPKQPLYDRFLKG